jgi:TolA-binding protein
MDKLLLHTAISLSKKGKKKEAKIFLNALISGYPDSSSVSEAKNYLKKLK